MNLKKDVAVVIIGVLLVSGIFYLYSMPSSSEKRFNEGAEHIRQGRLNIERGIKYLNSNSFEKASGEFNEASKKFLKAEQVFKEVGRTNVDMKNVSKDAENYAYLAYAGAKFLETGAEKFSDGGSGQTDIDKGISTLTTANEYLKDLQGFDLPGPVKPYNMAK